MTPDLFFASVIALGVVVSLVIVYEVTFGNCRRDD